MFIICLILVIVIIILICSNNEKENEIRRLKSNGNFNPNIINFCPKCGCDLYHRNSRGNYVATNNNYNTEQPKEYVNSIVKPVAQTKPKYTDKEVKNSLILITGSVLVIISALLFLTTTWNITNNIIKTLLLVLMLIVFFAASHIADKVLHLKQTAKAFRYIGLYFLPIVFFSISLFSLLGHSLSINGPNRYLYFFISSLIVTIIYYYSSVKHNSTLIKVSTIVFSVITIIIGTLIFTNNNIIVMIVLSLYLLILNLLYKSNKYLFDQNIHVKTLTTLLGAVFVLSFGFLLLNCASIKFADILLDGIVFINIYYYFCKVIDNKKIFRNVYPIYVILMFLHIGGLFDDFLTIQLLALISFPVVIIAELLTNETMSHASYIEIIATSSLLYLITIIYRLIDSNCIEGYYFVFATAVASFIHHYYNKESSRIAAKFSAYLFSSSVLFTILNILLVHKLSIIFLGIASLGMSLIFNNKNSSELSISGIIVGFIGFVISTLVMDYFNIITSLLFLFFSLYNMILFFKKGYKQYRYSSYIYYNLHLISLLLFFNKNVLLITNDVYLIIPITTILFVILEKFIEKLNDNSNHIYLLIQFILSTLLLLVCEFTIPNMILFIITCTIFIYYVNSIKFKDEWLLCPYLGIISYLHLKFLPSEYSYFSNIFNFISIGVLALFGYLIFKKKKTMYSVLYYLNALAYIAVFSPSKYLSIILIVIGTIISYLVKEGKEKDFYKSVLLICGLILAKFAIYDLVLDQVTMINIGVYVLWIPLFTRLIIRKHSISGCKVLEYITSIIVNIWAFTSYTSEYDGLLFVLLLVVLVIASYIIKLGPIFLVSICSILINVFILTREFWLTIPWWIYVLIIGIILIAFAVYNEINANKNKNNIIKEISKKIDL